MPLDPFRARLVRSHLAAGLALLEQGAASGRHNPLCVRALARAARLVEAKEIADCAVCLLNATPDGAFWTGAIANFELPATVPDSLRAIGPVEKLEKDHPEYHQQRLLAEIQAFAQTQQHIALCLQGRPGEARALAGSGVRLEEVGDTLAVLGELDAAAGIARAPALEDFRQRGVLFVLVIELFRRGRADEAAALLAELEAAGLGAWERIHLALGLGGRLPWSGYPYPDW